MIRRSDALKLLAEYRTNEAVLATMSAALEWPAFTNNERLDCPVRTCMGPAPSVGLGVALSQPSRKVWVLNGDGSQLMSLSSIATIAAAAPNNLFLFVFQNDTYEMTGGQPIPLAGRLDFSRVARALEFDNVHTFDDIGVLKHGLPALLKGDGPALIVLRVIPGDAPKTPKPNAVQEVRKFKRALEAES